MRSLLAAALLAGCHPAPASPDQIVYGKLVEAGCLSGMDPGDGVAVVAAEHTQFHDLGLDCLYDGGTVQACGVFPTTTCAGILIDYDFAGHDYRGRAATWLQAA